MNLEEDQRTRERQGQKGEEMFKNNCQWAVFFWGLEILRFYYVTVLQDGPTLLVLGIGQQREYARQQ